ncbi:MAG TPA: hypothetical protein VMM18_12365 [Gemmatimonadaceae bacterium]|nr:hypothetical protein [Gemmatimonadaceae bacterium]
MPLHHAGLRFPHERILLPRTKLAYVHLANLLTDAKRDRSARVFGYVAIWLPDELLLLYLQSGEVVNATHTGGDGFTVLPIASAIERVPHDPEFGEICFHEADDEQLACMFVTQVGAPDPWPEELRPDDPESLFPYLMSTTYDGLVEIVVGGQVNYLIFRDGIVARAFLTGAAKGTLIERVQALFSDALAGARVVRRWSIPQPLPHQTPPALVGAYRDLVRGLVARLVESGRDSAPAIAEHARRTLAEKHPSLERFSMDDERPRQDPAEEMDVVTRAVAAWVGEVLWTAADHDAVSPEALLVELTRDRRHMLQSAGFFEHLPFKVEW